MEDNDLRPLQMKYMRAELAFILLRFLWIAVWRDPSGSCLGLREATTRAHHRFLALEREYFAILRVRNAARGVAHQSDERAHDDIVF